MAISYKITVSEMGANSGNFNIFAEVTNDALAAEYQTEKVSVQGRLDTQSQKDSAIAALKQLYKAKAAKTTEKAALEADLKSNAEA